MKKEFILNENEYAESLLNGGKVKKDILAKINLLAKYFYFTKGLTVQQTVKQLKAFMNSHYEGYVDILWIDILEKTAKSVPNQKPLHEIESIPITQKELDTIALLHNMVLERYLFVMLCYCKAFNMTNDRNNDWVNMTISSLYKQARISPKGCSVSKDMYNRIYDIMHSGIQIDGKEFTFISLAKKVNNNLHIDFVDHEGEPVLNITDFRELGYQYLYIYQKDNFIKCVNCGVLMRKHNKKKYCLECSRKIKYYSPIVEKTLICEDCNKEFTVSSKNTKSTRCPECASEHQKMIDKERKKRFVENHKI